MKTLYTLLTKHADVVAGAITGLVCFGLVVCWLSYEDAALQAERRYRDLERLLVIVVRAVEAEASNDERGNGGASSRPGASGPGLDRNWRTWDLSAGVAGVHDGPTGTGRACLGEADDSRACMIVE